MTTNDSLERAVTEAKTTFNIFCDWFS